VLAALAGLAAPSAAAETGLVGRWPLDSVRNISDGVSLVTDDASGRGNHGGLFAASPFLAPGRFGQGFDFAVPPDPRVVMSNSVALQPQRVTVAAWVRRNGFPGSLQYLLSKGASQCTGPSYALYTGYPGNLGLQFFILSGGIARYSPRAPDSVWDGRWHAVAGVYDGASVRLYIDGAQVGAANPAPPTIDYGFAGSGQLMLGGYPYPCPTALSGRYAGGLDEVRIYDRALSAVEIARLADPGATSPPDPDVVAPPPGGGATLTDIALARPPQPGRPLVLVARGAGPRDRLAWDLRGDGRPEVVGDPGQDAVLFRVPAGRRASVGVQAIGPGGRGPALREAFAAPPYAPPRGTGRLIGRIDRAGDVYTTGAQGDLAAAVNRGRLRCEIRRDIVAHHAGLEIEGCLDPVNGLSDIPLAERGLMDAFLSRLGYGRKVAGGIDGVRYYGLADAASGAATGFVARDAVTVNGVTIDPEAGASVVIYPQAKLIASKAATLSVGAAGRRLVLGARRDFLIDTGLRAGRLPLGTFGLARGSLGRLAGFALGADVKVSIVPGAGSVPAGTEVTVVLKLPEWAETGGVRFQSQVVVRATRREGLVLENLDIGPASVDLGALSLEDFLISYRRAEDEWRGQARGCLAGGACLDMVPDRGRVIIKNGELKEAGATLVIPPPGLPLYPGVALSSFGFRFGTDPTFFGGSARVTAIKVYEIDGRLLVAFPSRRAPYIPSREGDGAGFPADFYGRPITTPAVAAAADAAIRVPVVGRIPLGGGYFVYEYPGYTRFGGGVSRTFFDRVRVSGGVFGEFNAANGRFNLRGATSLCALLPNPFGDDVDICAAGQSLFISSRGFSACIIQGVSIGVGATWDPFSLDIYFPDGCKWSPYVDRNVRAARIAGGGGPYSVTIRPGDRTRGIRFDSATDAPRLRVTGPGGRTLATDVVRPLQRAGSLSMLRSTRDHLTIVGLTDPAPGTYRIEQLPGSVPVRRVREAISPPDAHVAARVDGAGVRRVLRYEVRPRPRQSVTFVDVAGPVSREIGTVRGGGTGRLRFTTIPGRGRHRIEARVELNGHPSETRTVARYRAPSAVLGRPRSLWVARRGTTLLARWGRVAGAGRYEVVATTTDRGQRRLRTRRTGALFRGVPGGTAGVVSVRAVDGVRAGRPRMARFSRTARRPSRLARLPRVSRALRRAPR